MAAWRAGRQNILLSLQEAMACVRSNQAQLSSRAASDVLQELSYVLAAFSALDPDGELTPERLDVITPHLHELHDVLQRAGARFRSTECNSRMLAERAGSRHSLATPP